MQPKDAQTKIDGIWHKVGVRGLVFAWVNGEWLRSSRYREDVERVQLNLRKPQGQFWRYMDIGAVERVLDEGAASVKSTVWSHANKTGKRFTFNRMNESVYSVKRVE